MRAADGFHVEWVEDEAVVLSPVTGELHYLNTSAALVYALIQEYGYEEGLARLSSVAGEGAVTEEEIKDLIADMVDRGLLTDD